MPSNLVDSCPPCKLLLNSGGSRRKLEQLEAGMAILAKNGLTLSPEATKKAIEVICGFDDEMDDVLKLLETSIVKA